MKRSMEQLLSQTWPTRDAAAKELKRNGFPDRGEDYEIAVSGNGLWQINTFSDVIAKPKTAKPAEAEAPGAQPLPIRPEPRKRGDVADAGAAKGKKAAKGKEAVVAPPAGEEPPGRDDTTVPNPAAAPNPNPPAPPTGIDLSALPTDGGPYALAVRAADVMQDSAVLRALDVSKALGVPCDVLGADGQVLRTVDNVAVTAARKAARHGQGSSPIGRRRAPSARPNAMVAQAIELACRPGGVTREQLRAVSSKQQPWTAIIKDAATRWGYVYRTSEAPADSKSRTVYHLDEKPTE